MVQLSVVVPTFNEGDHILAFLSDLEAANAGRDYEIIVVDDNSPDGTHAKVAAYAHDHPRIVPILRMTEKGLATAVLEGMRRSRGDFIVVMDSDFQHPPETVPRLLDAALVANADCVVASRYAPGGSVTGFPLVRRIISWGARTLAVLGLPIVRRFRVRDPMSGFFLVRRDRVSIEALRPRGYKILLEILARAPVQRVVEVGFAFQNRRGGESKLRVKTQYDYLLHVVYLSWADQKNRRLAKFMLVGVTGIGIHLSIQALLAEHFGWRFLWPFEFQGRDLHLGSLLAAAFAREGAIVWNYLWNDRVTFRHERPHAHAGFFHRMWRFHLVSLTSFAGYLLAFGLLAAAGLHYLVASFIAILLSFVLNYSGNVRWTYERRKDAPGH